jgi:putative tricarboxylic transport membrane protein
MQFTQVCHDLRDPRSLLVLALVLGPMLEDNLRQALTISGGNFLIFISRPLSVAFLAVSASALLFPLVRLRPRLRETTE